MLRANLSGLRRVLRVSGPDARPLLQALVTADVASAASPLVPGSPVFCALLDPRGRVLHHLHLHAEGEGGESAASGAVLLDACAGAAPALLSRLRAARLRRKCEVEFDDSLSVVAEFPVPSLTLASTAPPTATASTSSTFAALPPDARAVPSLGLRGLLPAATAARHFGRPDAEDADSLRAAHAAARLLAGCPEGVVEAPPGRAGLALEGGLDAFPGGVSFSKGCYVGQASPCASACAWLARGRLAASSSTPPFPAPQEMTARTRHVLVVRRRWAPVWGSGPVPAGVALVDGSAPPPWRPGGAEGDDDDAAGGVALWPAVGGGDAADADADGKSEGPRRRRKRPAGRLLAAVSVPTDAAWGAALRAAGVGWVGAAALPQTLTTAGGGGAQLRVSSGADGDGDGARTGRPTWWPAGW